jgi:hypothetical protein
MSTWNKDLAAELIQAGFIRLSKKYHPDVGGKHEDMLALTATKEHLESLLGGQTRQKDPFGFTDSRSYQRDPRYYGNRWRHRPSDGPKDEPNPEVPIEPYPHDPDYMMLADITIMEVREKAIKVKIPKVKNPQWLPISQLHEDWTADGPHNPGDVLDVVFTRWIARQKGWLK